MKGVEVVSAELSPEISPVIILEDNTTEWQFLQAVRLCVSSFIQQGVALQNTIIRARNPAGSGVIAVVTRVAYSPNITSQFLMGFANTLADLPTAAATAVRDHRWASAANPTTLVVSRSNDVGFSFSDSLWATDSLGFTPQLFDSPFVILPGETIEMGTTTPEVTLRMGLSWTERQLPRLER